MGIVELGVVDIRIVFCRMDDDPRGNAMDERITDFETSDWDDGRGGEPQVIGDILADLLKVESSGGPERT